MPKTQKGVGKRRSIISTLFVLSLFLGVFLMLAGSVTGLVVVHMYGKDLPSLENLTKRQEVVTRVTDRNGTVICEIGSEKRIVVKPGTLPKVVKNATVASEDQRFYSHHGIDYYGIIRAFGKGLLKGGKFKQGGSSITQQVAKNYILTREKTLPRKIKEALIAEKIEEKYSKEEILELYLNTVNYGFGRYGIESGSRFYFGKSASELTLAEAALLVGLHPSPERYSPRKNMKRALQRRAYVLRRMLEDKMITQEEYNVASKEVPRIISDRPTEASAAQEVCDYVREFLERYYTPKEIDYLGFNIETSIDLELQVKAKNYLRVTVTKIKERHRGSRRPEGAVVIMNPHTREVIALVGGAFYTPGGLNRALYAKRSPGSTFKLIGYAAGFAAGKFTPDTIFSNERIAYEDNGREWRPRNYEGEDEDKIITSVGEAFAHSYNTVAVKAICGFDMSVNVVPPIQVAQRRGMPPEYNCKDNGIIDETIAMAETLGIQLSDKAKRERNPSIILGSEVVTPIQILNAYATFSAHGNWAEPVIITKIIGNNAPQLPLRESRVAVDGQTLGMSRTILRQVVTNGTGRRIQGKLSQDAFGKTGTTPTDAWFVGFTQSYATVVWVGHDSQTIELSGETGASASLPVWIDSMRAVEGKDGAMVNAMRNKPVKEAADTAVVLEEPLAEPETVDFEPVAEPSFEHQQEADSSAFDVDEELAKIAAEILSGDSIE